MATYKATVHSPMPVEEVFNLMADFSKAPEWDANTKSSELKTDDPFAVGARFDIVTAFAGRDLNLTYETIEIERPNRVVLRSGTAIAVIEDIMTFEAEGDGTKVNYEANIRPKSVAKVIDPIFSMIFKRVGDHALESMKVALKAK